jgi:anaphase-promoting complex subunit 6
MSVYRTCTRLFPGSHLPHLYIGMENLRTNSLHTAHLNFQTAHDLSKQDPMVLNEMGVTFYKRKMYQEAKETFIKALELSAESESWVKESILCNIGHSCRKAGYSLSYLVISRWHWYTSKKETLSILGMEAFSSL